MEPGSHISYPITIVDRRDYNAAQDRKPATVTLEFTDMYNENCHVCKNMMGYITDVVGAKCNPAFLFAPANTQTDNASDVVNAMQQAIKSGAFAVYSNNSTAPLGDAFVFAFGSLFNHTLYFAEVGRVVLNLDGVDYTYIPVEPE